VIFLFLGLLATAYLGAWMFKVRLGLIRPCANLAYFYYSEEEWLDRSLYVFFWPCYRGLPRGCVHHGDRVYPKAGDLAAP
jgi:hypothetical protein